MDKRQGVPNSSFAASIFGEDSSPSSGTFASIFPAPQTVAGKKMTSELTTSPFKQFPGNPAWTGEQGADSSGGASGNKPSRDSPIFQEDSAELCHLSSSLFYGGQDVYSQFPSTQNPGSYPIFKKHGEKYDHNDNANSHGASRGNWWQGSLYY